MRREKRVLLLFPVVIALMFGLQLLHPGSLGYAQLTGTVIPLVALGFVATDITLKKKERERAERRIIPPARQLKYLSDEYGLSVTTSIPKPDALPIVTVPSVSGATLGHVCNAGYYGNVKFCPVHGENAPQAAGNCADLAEPDPVPDDLSTYVPAGQGELLRDLYGYMGAQVQADVEANGKRRLSASCWHIGPEWLKEVRKLKGPTGAPLFVPRHRQEKWQTVGTLFGYPVVIGDQYGVPELTALLSLVM